MQIASTDMQPHIVFIIILIDKVTLVPLCQIRLCNQLHHRHHRIDWLRRWNQQLKVTKHRCWSGSMSRNWQTPLPNLPGVWREGNGSPVQAHTSGSKRSYRGTLWNRQGNNRVLQENNNFMEFGKPKAQGERNDLADVYESLKVGRSLQDIIEEHPGTYIRYLRGIERVQDIFRRKQQKLEERVQPTVIVFTGRSGIRESHHCYNGRQ